MKKNNGGYVLAYVMIVITVVSAMALAVGSVAVRNLQVQEAAVERMQDLYAAEGEIERFQAWVKDQKYDETKIEEYPKSRGLTDNHNVNVNVEVGTVDSEKIITVIAKAKSTTVTAVMEVEVDSNNTVKQINKYQSYNITATQE